MAINSLKLDRSTLGREVVLPANPLILGSLLEAYAIANKSLMQPDDQENV